MNDTPKSKRHLAGTLIRAGLSVLLIGYLVHVGVLDFSVIGSLHWNVFWLGFAFIPVSYVFTTHRWLELLKAQNIRLGFWPALQLNLTGSFFSLVIPGSHSGDLVKIYYSVRRTESMKTPVALSILLDRLIGLQTILILSSIALVPLRLFYPEFFTGDFVLIFWAVAGAGLACLVFAILFVTVDLERIRPVFWIRERVKATFIQRMLQSVLTWQKLYRAHPVRLLKAYGYSALNQLCIVVVFFFCERLAASVYAANQQTVPKLLGFFEHAGMDLINIAVSFIPITPMSIGVREGMASYCYQHLGSPLGAETGILITISFSLWFAVAGGLAFSLLRSKEPNLFKEFDFNPK